MNKAQVLAFCTQAGLDTILIEGVAASRVLVACIQVESGFNQYAVNFNKNAEGAVTSIDYGICQINDFFHIGTGKEFATPEYVLSNPQVCVIWMIALFKQGKQTLWSSFTSGAYKKYL